MDYGCAAVKAPRALPGLEVSALLLLCAIRPEPILGSSGAHDEAEPAAGPPSGLAFLIQRTSPHWIPQTATITGASLGFASLRAYGLPITRGAPRAAEITARPYRPSMEAYDVGRFTIDVANDDFGSDVDEAFTSGIEVAIRTSPSKNLALSGLVPWLRVRRVREYWALVLGQEIHTPALLQVTDLEILKNDRRYAGWLYGALRAELALAHSPFIEDGYSFYRIQLTVGSTGPRTQTEALQRYWHAFIRDALRRRRLPEDPKGWGIYQVPNHWGVNLEGLQEAEVLRWSTKDEGLKRTFGSDLGFRVASLLRVRAGNMWVDASFGAILRAGFLPEVVFDEMGILSTHRGRRADLPLAAYGFVSGRGIASLHNTLLEGPPGADGPYPEQNHFLAQLEAGFALRFSVVEFAFRHTTLSPDLNRRPPGGVWIQNWGRITLTFAFY